MAFTFDRLWRRERQTAIHRTPQGHSTIAKALVESAPGKTLLAYTAMLSFNELAGLWSQTTGQPAKHR